MQLEQTSVEHQPQLYCTPWVIAEVDGAQVGGCATVHSQSAEPVEVLNGQFSGVALSAEKSDDVHGLTPGRSGTEESVAIVPCGEVRGTSFGSPVQICKGCRLQMPGRSTGECSG